MQIVVTTHSPEVLDAAWIRPENLRLVTWEAGTTLVSPVGQSAQKALKEHLMGAGELLRSNALQPLDLFSQAPESIPLFVSLP